MIKFSVVIPTYKNNYLEECISSVLNQTYENLELIIVNDASPYDIDSIVSKFKDKRIKYYKNEKNCGAVNVVDNWNICLSYATGDYLICIGDDDRLCPNCLAEYHKLIETYPDIKLLHARTELIDENGNFLRYQYERPEWESVYAFIYNRFKYRCDQFIGDFCFEITSLRKLGGFHKIPLAWGSDDITAVKSAAISGVANTQKVAFQYRVNRHTISNNGNTELKIKSIYEEIAWYQTFLSNKPKEKEDLNYYNGIKDTCFPSYQYKKIQTLIAQDIASSNILRVFHWIIKKDKLKLNNSLLVKSIIWSFVFKSSKK